MADQNFCARWSRWSPYLLSLLRIVVAFAYVQHGTQKLFAFPAPMGPNGTVPLHTIFGAAGIIETIGGLLLLVGLCTRPVAFICSGEMAVAYFKYHAPHGFWTLLNHGEIVAVFCFTWLYLSAVGGGAWSLDALLRRGGRP